MSDLTQPPHVPSCVSTGEGVTVPTATATPRTDEALIEKLRCTDGGEEECTVYPAEEIVDADFARTLERELSSAQRELAEAKREATAQGEHAVAMTELAQSLQAELAEAKAEVARERRMRQTMESRHGEVVAYNSQVRAEVDRLNREVDTLLFIKADCDQLRARVAELVAAMYEAIREARTLECNTDPLVDRILKPAIDAAKGTP